MRQSNRRVLSSTLAIALAAGTVTVVAPSALANPQGTNVVINEVYGGGGNNNATLKNDFVELYNPTDQEIDISGWTILQRSKTNTGNGSFTFPAGTKIPAKSYYVILGDTGSGKGTEEVPNVNITSQLGFGGTEAIAYLNDASGTTVDMVGWGAATVSEGAPAGKTTNATSVQRKADGFDTDNNATDFKVAAPTPGTSNGADSTPSDPNPADPTSPADPQPQPQPGTVTPIAEIQGTGDKSPLEGKTVTTEGVVTAVYSEGGKNGFYLQTAGSGSVKNPGDASDGIFVYMGSRTDYPERGDSVQVTGKVNEFKTTQITASSISKLDTKLEAPKAVEIDTLPAGDAAREPYEGMLVRPKGPYTVTNNYTLNTFGELGLAPGTEAHRTPTDVVAPGAPAQELQAKQDAEVVYLDDARTANYFFSDKETPLPYIVTSDGGVKSIRTTDQVQFQTDVVVEYSFDHWRFQPLEPITGKNTAAELPITWEDSRQKTLNQLDGFTGENSVGFFNVLNYFSTTGEKFGCKTSQAYKDKDNQPVAVDDCGYPAPRGAYNDQAFKDQQAKIVTAINKLNADVLGLSEIENTASLYNDQSRRDEALKNLVDALNAKGGNWDYVKSPQKIAQDEDVIRVAFIYNKDKVEPVGDSIIIDRDEFHKVARQPLVQEFNTLNKNDDENFVVVVNHYKSKGSVAADADNGDGQGNNAQLRKRESEALRDELAKLSQEKNWQKLPTFLVGDFNAYSKEDAITVLNQAGYEEANGGKTLDPSYQFGGQLGSLDHVLGNQAARDLVTDAVVWNINGDEPVPFEYSRRNYNAQDFLGSGDDALYGYGNPFRASDHDPVKVGFGTPQKEETDAEKYAPEAGDEVTVEQGAALPDAKTAVKDADRLPEDTTFAWDDATTDTVGDAQERTVTVTYPDKTTDQVKVKVNVKAKEEAKPRYIAKTEINNNGELVITYSDGQTDNLGKVTGNQGQAGAAGRGIKETKVNDKGELVVTYTDGTTQNLGKVAGTQGQTGRGIAKTEIDSNGDLIITYTDGATQNAGKVQSASRPSQGTGSTGSSGSSTGSSIGGFLGILLGILAAIAAGVGVLYYYMPDVVNAQLEQWGLR